jgi:hypothetical protein
MKPQYEFIKSLPYEELQLLSALVNGELHQKNPETIAENKRLGEYFTEQMRKEAAQEILCKKVIAALKNILKPGMRLKMIGCKDGRGIREFIRWDDDNLVCWQLRCYRQWHRKSIDPEDGEYRDMETKTNQVTTHMPDKVSWVMIDGKQVPVRKLLA